MRTVLIRAGIVVIGILMLAGVGYRMEDGRNEAGTDTAAKNGEAVYIRGASAGFTAHIAMMLSDAALRDDKGKASAIEAEQAPEMPEDCMEKRQAEEARNRCLTDYFGYVPTEEELDLFYRAVQAECGNTEPEDGIGAVADVIANRCRSDIFPDTLTEVITQKNQFATWDNGAIAEAVPQPWVYEICDDHISEGAVYEDIYYFTAGGYNRYCEPAFVIGNHYFGR